MVVEKGFKQTELGVIPEDWEFKLIGDIAKISMGQSPLSSNYNSNGVGLPLVQGNADIKNRKTIIRNYTSQITKTANEGDVIMSVRAPVGEVAKSTFNCCIGRGVCSIKYFNDYIFQYLIYFENSWGQYSTGSTFDSVNSEQVKSLRLPLPPLPEQTAIATTLSDMDALIAQTGKLIEKKKAIKQGVMQELLRPKEGWENVAIRDISKVGRGRVISNKEISKSIEELYPVYSSQTTNNGIMGFIDSFDFEGEYITWTTDGEKAGTVFYRNGRFNCTNVCGTIKLKNYNAKFIAYVLAIESPKHVSRNLANPKLMNEPMKNVRITIPKDINEQEDIANSISYFENEIEALESKYNKLKHQKQGMMQALLTGKIRLV